MKDKFIKELLKDLDRLTITAGQVKKDFDESHIDENLRVIPLDRLIDAIDNLDRMLEEERKRTMPKTKFLYVEDGSVDVDELYGTLSDTNPEIKIIVYRQGSRSPELIEVEGE